MSTPSRRTFIQLLAGALATALAPPIPALAVTSTIPFRVVRRLRLLDDVVRESRMVMLQDWLTRYPKDHPHRWMVKMERYNLWTGARPRAPTVLVQRLDTGTFGITKAESGEVTVDINTVEAWFRTEKAAVDSVGGITQVCSYIVVDDFSLPGVV